FKSGPKAGSGASPAGSKELTKGQPDRRSGAGQKLAPGASQPGMDPDDVLDLAADPRASAKRGPISQRAAERSRVVAQSPPAIQEPPTRKFNETADRSRVVTQSPPIAHEPPTRGSREGTVFG